MDVMNILLMIGFGLTTGAYFGYVKAQKDIQMCRRLSHIVQEYLDYQYVSVKELDKVITVCEHEIESRVKGR